MIFSKLTDKKCNKDRKNIVTCGFLRASLCRMCSLSGNVVALRGILRCFEIPGPVTVEKASGSQADILLHIEQVGCSLVICISRFSFEEKENVSTRGCEILQLQTP